MRSIRRRGDVPAPAASWRRGRSDRRSASRSRSSPASVPHAAAHQPHRLRRQRAARAGRRVSPRGRVDADGQLSVTLDLPQSERFFAGGDTTIRGFALDRVGMRHIPPQPTRHARRGSAADRRQRPGDPQRRAARAGRGGLGVVGFVDSGQRVRARRRDRPRRSCAPRSAAASATSRRSGRSASTSASRSTVSRAKGSRPGSSASDRRSERS